MHPVSPENLAALWRGVTLSAMTRAQLTLLSIIVIAAGGGLVFYLLTIVPPVDGTGQLDTPAVTLFFIGLTLGAMGVSSLIASVLHLQWPTLAGVGPRSRPPASAALRQGIIFGAAFLLLALLAFFQRLDIALILVTLLVAWLLEAFIQNRG